MVHLPLPLLPPRDWRGVTTHAVAYHFRKRSRPGRQQCPLVRVFTKKMLIQVWSLIFLDQCETQNLH
jgi:hypothetical protein